jgi:hypothetical protein
MDCVMKLIVYIYNTYNYNIGIQDRRPVKKKYMQMHVVLHTIWSQTQDHCKTTSKPYNNQLHVTVL